jgi:hypothetical protein
VTKRIEVEAKGYTDVSGCVAGDVVDVEVEPVVVDVDDVVEVNVVEVGVETVARPITTPTPATTSAPAIRMSAFGKFFVMASRFFGLDSTVCREGRSVPA